MKINCNITYIKNKVMIVIKKITNFHLSFLVISTSFLSLQ